MDASDQHQLCLAATAEIVTRGLTSTLIRSNIAETMAMIGFVQLGLRHPEAADKPSAELARGMITDLISQLSPPGSPLHELLMKGFDPEWDLL